MKRIITLILFFTVCLSTSWAQNIQIGMSQEALLKNKPTPQGEMSHGTKTIYDWSDMQVWVVNGKVTKIETRKPKSQAEIDQERRAAQQAQAQRQQDAKELAAKREKAQEAASAQSDSQATAEASSTQDVDYIDGVYYPRRIDEKVRVRRNAGPSNRRVRVKRR